MKKTAAFLYAEDWKEKTIKHRTPSGQIREIKIKSLPPEEQEKYKPKGLKGLVNKFKENSRIKSEKNKAKKDFIQSLKPDENFQIKEFSTKNVSVGMHGDHKLEINDEKNGTGWKTVDLEKPLSDQPGEVQKALKETGLYSKIEKLQKNLSNIK